MRSPKTAFIAGLAFLVVLVLWKSLIIYTEWLWLSQVGYASVFVTLYKARLLLFLVVGVGLFAWLWANCRLARRTTSEDVTFIGKRLLPPAERAAIERHVDKAILIVAVLIAIGAAVLASQRAVPLLQFSNSTSFTAGDGTVLRDPIFGKEIAFYVFRLPLIEYVWGVIYHGLLLALALAGLVYFYEESLRVLPGTIHLAPQARRHLFLLLAAVFGAKALGFWLERFRLLAPKAAHGVVQGIGYADLYARIPVYWFLIVVAVVCAVVALVAIRRLSVRVVGMAIAAVVVFTLLGKWAAPAAVQAIVVKPAELAREGKFLRYNIDYTRDAYDLTNVRVAPYKATPLTAQDIVTNPATINNVRLWDDRPVETVANQVHQLRTYYEFADVDVDRYTINGQMRQVMVSARQLNVQNLSPQSQTWVNTHMQYTHGYGFVVAPVNEIAGNRRPNFLVKDIPPPYPPPSGLQAFAVPAKRAGLYFQVAVEREMPQEPAATGPSPGGPAEEPPPAPASRQRLGRGARPARRGTRLVQRLRTTTDFCIVGGRADELDYPRDPPDLNATTRYSGKDGVRVSSFLRRFAFFVRFRSWPLLFSSDIVRESRILMYRTVSERISAIAPFLALDFDPYLVIADGKLQWINDAYTVTDRYPYSERPTVAGQRLGVNYLRNSVKVCVDAYDGTVNFYVFDERDPVLQTYRKIFPDLFKDRRSMPPSLMAHIRYPETLFRIQSQMYQVYHMTDVGTFYQQEDRWDFPDEEYAGQGQTMEAYYVVMRLPERARQGQGSGGEEFLLMTPFTPYGKSDRNMVAWMCARCDPQHYGELVVYLFPKDRMIQGPMMVEASIGADAEISQMETLWGGTGSRVIRGNLLVIPIDSAILYVEPLYVQTERSPIPELKIVIVGANESITWGSTLGEALGKMFGREAGAVRAIGGPPTGATGPATALSPQVAQLAGEILTLYRRANELRSQGDFVGYEQQQKELDPLLQRLVELTQSAPAGSATAPPSAAPGE